MRPWLTNLRRLIRRKRPGHRITFTGDYDSWEAALRETVGYDAAVILEKTRAAMLKIKNGEARYERDSVLFDKVEYSFPVLALLLRAALENNGRLSVLDFGGALGSSYFQCRSFLQSVRHLEWLVVEQPGHVACGKRDFESSILHFYESTEACLASHQPNVLLLSSVLQYLSGPHAMLREFLSLGLPYAVIDRTPFLASGRDRLTVQHVPSAIYEASYPAWFFSEAKFKDQIQSAGYEIITDFPGRDKISPVDEAAYFKGFILRKEGG